MVQVDIDLAKCTGCSHCKDVCPVNVFDLKPRDQVPDVVDDPTVGAKFQFRGEKSLAVNGPECIVCEACLFSCEGECILITDDENHVHFSVFE
ncbi:MAG: 4Fe-4S dicluster domain-containing protein [Thermoplasmata archaeon]|nr:4Fe-4S dicluster domain-containing protein [Thermoplasmata archaeon]